MNFKIAVCLIFLGFVTSLQAQPYFKKGQDPKLSGKKWVKLENMSDEFNGKTIDLSKWQIDPLANDWGWNGRPPGLFRAENVSLAKGNMRVTVGKLDSVVQYKDNKFTHQGGIVRSLNPGQAGWYYECRMKANATEMSSTFWLMSRYDCLKKQELDIHECVGRTTGKTEPWAKNWDRIFHSNTIHRTTPCVPKPVQLQGSVILDKPNHKDYHVYAAWWKSPEEIQFFLDGKFVYTIKPNIGWDMPAWLHMAIETYDWNPIPEDGGMVESGSLDERTTKYDWIRTWKLE